MHHRHHSHPHTRHSPIQDRLDQLFQELRDLREGSVATYIPELAKANPDWLGISVVTANGGLYEIGDSRQPFTIQSISKPFVYGLALEDRGRVEVMTKVGVEPTGDAFNSISLEPGTGRPRNPMINAGAIASTGMIEGRTAEIRFKRIQEMLSRYAGRELSVDEAVFKSESDTGHRNRAIAYMLRNFDILTADPMPDVEAYFRQCSVLVDCRDLATMAATLANRGINPLTGEQAIRGEYVECVLGIMGSCGMYDYAGEWLHNVGMPAKSGVSGGIIAVLPGQLGIGVFSPPLDSHGNSVRGIRACNVLSRYWDLHLFNRPGIGKSAIRMRTTAASFNSNCVRNDAEVKTLRAHGERIHLYQLQGNLMFAMAELVVRELIERAEDTDSLILDFKHVLTINESACHLFHDLLCGFSETGRVVLFTGLSSSLPLRRLMKARLGGRFDKIFRAFDDIDPALEWCEDRLLAHFLSARDQAEVLTRDYELFRGLTDEELAIIEREIEHRQFPEGKALIEIGSEAKELFLLARGRVSVFLPLPSGAKKRLAAFSPGMAFGEMAVIDRAPRSATIVADTDVTCGLLTIASLEKISEQHPRIMIKLMENLSLSLCQKLRKANREISFLM